MLSGLCIWKIPVAPTHPNSVLKKEVFLQWVYQGEKDLWVHQEQNLMKRDLPMISVHSILAHLEALVEVELDPSEEDPALNEREECFAELGEACGEHLVAGDVYFQQIVPCLGFLVVLLGNH